jgi:hypothetical protein
LLNIGADVNSFDFPEKVYKDLKYNFAIFETSEKVTKRTENVFFYIFNNDSNLYHKPLDELADMKRKGAIIPGESKLLELAK